jgi:arylformamidase
MSAVEPSEEILYLGYTQQELDWLYDLGRRVPGVEEYRRGYEAESAKVRERFPDQLEIPYGDHPREKLDIFPAERKDAPVFVFIHGGYWRQGTKERWSYVANGVAPLGVTAVVAEYALIPTVDMSELINQCRRAIAWVHKHAAEFGCDPNRIHVGGHSAGGHLTGMLMATPWEDWGVDPRAIRGGLALSGLYDLEPIRACFLQKILGLNDHDVRHNSPVRLVPTVDAPLHISVGGDEGAEYLRQSKVMQAHWEGRRGEVRTEIMEGENHFQIVQQLGDPSSQLCQELLRQVER